MERREGLGVTQTIRGRNYLEASLLTSLHLGWENVKAALSWGCQSTHGLSTGLAPDTAGQLACHRHPETEHSERTSYEACGLFWPNLGSHIMSL